MSNTRKIKNNTAVTEYICAGIYPNKHNKNDTISSLINTKKYKNAK